MASGGAALVAGGARAEVGIPIENQEMVTARQLNREFSRVFSRLEKGEVEKIVVTRRGKMVAIVVAPEDYEELAAGGRP